MGTSDHTRSRGRGSGRDRDMNFHGIEKIAAAILYEGYILYPYRPTAIKNRQRWNFGTLYPRMYAEAQRPPEPFHLVAECLLTAEANASLDLKISFLQLVPQQRNSSEDLHELSDPSLAWDEAVERTSEHQNLLLTDLIGSPLRLTAQMDAADLPERRSSDEATGPQAILTIDVEILQDGACKLHLELENATNLFSGKEARRDEALPRSFVSAHLLLGINRGEFVSRV